MIKLTDVGKTYVSKSKSKVEALKGVSFELTSNGMIFILGKSGSGKSTLLNLLGGLDRPTFGSIQVDGSDMQTFNQTDYESYRNGYVGFVFQEYNLLDDFNVKDNIALALQLSKDVNVEEKVTAALKQVELNEEYLTRRVGELSGGEKQRIAIARAIVKDSKMILADEPTGNLDSETGESIWKILKRLSETRPVIIVSHDRESAEQYADRIIEISDGRIISDSGAAQEHTEQAQAAFVPRKQRLSFLMLLKMGFNNLFKHKARAISVILVSVLTVCALLVSQLVLTFLPERSVAKHIYKYDLPYATVKQGYEKSLNDIYTPRGIYSQGGHYKKLSTLNYIKQYSQTLDWGFADSKQELLDFGFEFDGEALELNSKSFYLTQSEYEKYSTEALYREESVIIIDGEEKSLYYLRRPIDELIGCQTKLSSFDGFYTLAGIIKDDNINIDLPHIFVLENFEGKFPSQYAGVSLNCSGKDVAVQANGNKNLYNINLSNEEYNRSYQAITADGIVYTRDIKLNEGEVLIGFSLFSRLFHGGEQDEYIKKGTFDYVLLKTPSAIGQTIDFEFFDYELDELLTSTGDVTIKGVTLLGEKDDYSLVCVNSLYNRLYRKLSSDGIIIKNDTVSNINKFLVEMRTNHMGYVEDVGHVSDVEGEEQSVAQIMYSIEALHNYSIIMIVICAVLSLVMILLVINLISFSINKRKKEIGILSALGASTWDITKIFLMETLVMSLGILVLSMIMIFVMVGIFNAVFSKIYLLTVTLGLFIVDIYAILTLFGICFIVLPLFALLPTIRIAKLKPIDAIRAL